MLQLRSFAHEAIRLAISSGRFAIVRLEKVPRQTASIRFSAADLKWTCWVDIYHVPLPVITDEDVNVFLEADSTSAPHTITRRRQGTPRKIVAYQWFEAPLF